MNKSRLAVAVIAGSLVMGSDLAVAARGFDYSYGQGAYRRVDGDDITGNGMDVGFSFGATDMFLIDGSYSRLWVDDVEGTSSSDIDIDEYKIGFGAHYSITDSLDVVGTLRYVDIQVTGDARLDGDDFDTSFNEDSEGYEFEVDGRYQATKELEVTPHVVYVDVGGEDETGFGAGLVYRLDRTFSLRAKATYFSDSSESDLVLGVRMAF